MVNPDMKAELNVSVKDGNFELNNKYLEWDPPEDLGAIWHWVPAAHRKSFLYGSSKGQRRRTCRNKWTVCVPGSILSGGSGETAYRTQSSDLAMPITVSRTWAMRMHKMYLHWNLLQTAGYRKTITGTGLRLMVLWYTASGYLTWAIGITLHTPTT